MIRLFTLLFMLTLSLYALPHAINEQIRKSGIAKKDISIYIKEAGKKGKVVASLNAQKTRTPASVIKVLTTYAALLKLGFNYRWPTKFYTTGNIQSGVLNGNLIIKGFGDPSLMNEDLGKIVSYIKAEGIRAIHGDIVIDRSYFKIGNKDSSGFDENPYSPYNAMPDAMMFNERVSTVCVTPRNGNVYKESVDHSYQVVNKLQYVNRSCRGKYSWPKVKIDKTIPTTQLILHGKVSKRCGQQNICRVVTKPYQSFYYALKDKLKEEGVRVDGSFELKKLPSHATELFTYYGDSLEKIVAKTNKKSNNLYARHLQLLLGAKVFGAPSTLQKGRDAITKILSSKGALGTGVLRIDNGSGLSRVSKSNAKLIATMLDDAYDRYGKRWMETLSIAGVDGTIKKRFRGTVVRKRAWMKTGTLRRVKNIGGYVKNKAGKYYTVVILINSPKAKYRGTKLQNEIMKWLVSTSAKPTTKRPITYTPPSVQKIEDTSKRVKPERTATKNTGKTVQNIKKNSTAKYYYIQVGSFKRKPSETFMRKIRAHGLPTKVKRTDIYRVLVGPYKKESTARKMLKKVRSKVNKSAFVTRQ
jgi:D-alanyl-D-alanine carboxypeptidase/D-alanyl-D-alanine-endopeptidase (penicillin-binding protein 4)